MFFPLFIHVENHAHIHAQLLVYGMFCLWMSARGFVFVRDERMFPVYAMYYERSHRATHTVAKKTENRWPMPDQNVYMGIE